MATLQLLAANNAKSTLASNLSSGGTTISLAPGTGALFPSPGANQYFTGTLKDAATGTFTEIVWVTARSVDSLTVVRAQEGTSARAWLAGDQFNNNLTAGSLQFLTQPTDLQKQVGNYALTTGNNNIVATLSTIPAAYTAGLELRLTKNGNPNTGAVSLNVNGLGAKSVVNSDGSALTSGALPANSTFIVVYDGTNFVLQGLSGQTGITANQLQQQAGNYGVDSGTANALVVTLSPAPANLAALVGVPVRILKSAAANTGTATLTVNGFATTAIVWGDGSSMAAGNLPAGSLFEVVYNGTAFVLQGTPFQPPTLAYVQQQPGNYGTTTGTNNLATTLPIAPPALVAGLTLRLTKNANANTNAVSLNVNALGSKPVVYADGTALSAGALPANGTFQVTYDGTNFILVPPLASSLTPTDLQEQAGNFDVTDTGSANAVVVALTPAPVNLAALVGVPVRVVKSAAANTGAVTIAVNGFTATPIIWADGTALSAGQMIGGALFEVIFDGTNFILQTPTFQPASTLSVQAQTGNYAVDTGTANAIAISLSPAPATLAVLNGVVIRIKKAAFLNTGAVTINVNGLGATALTYSSSEAVSAGSLKANGDIEVVYDNALAKFILLSVTGSDQIRSLLLSGSSISTNGYLNLGGLKIQWAQGAIDPANITEPSQTINWPTPFNICFWAAVSMDIAAVDTNVDVWYQTAGWTTTGVTVQRQYPGTGSVHQTTQPFVLGIGT